MGIKETASRSEEILKTSPLRNKLKTNEVLPIIYDEFKQTLNRVENDIDVLNLNINNALKIALIGEVKSGKSTLLNALAGGRVSPTNVVESTASIIEVYHSSEKKACIYTESEIIKGTTEEIFDILIQHNNDQQFFKGIKSVKIGCPLKNLKELYLIDTPGIATITEENEKRTVEFIQHADVVLWVINGNYLGQSDVEEELIRVAKMGKPVIAVINRIDEVDAKPQEIIDYVEDEIGIYLKRTFAISASNAYEAITKEDKEAIASSGYNELLNYLVKDIERNANEVKTESVVKSIKASLNAEIYSHEMYIRNLENIHKTIDSHTDKVQYHSKRIIERIERKLDNWINFEFMHSEEAELNSIVDELKIIDKSSVFEEKFKGYLGDKYITNELNKCISNINALFKEEWKSSCSVINEEITRELKFFSNKKIVDIKETVMEDMPEVYKLALGGMKEGATMAGVWGTALAGYSAWIGPHAAVITMGTALGSIVPPILIAGALTGAVAKLVKFKNQKQEYILNVKKQIESIRKEIGHKFVIGFIKNVEEKNKEIASEIENQFIYSMCNGVEYEKIEELKVLIESYNNNVKKLESSLDTNI